MGSCVQERVIKCLRSVASVCSSATGSLHTAEEALSSAQSPAASQPVLLLSMTSQNAGSEQPGKAAVGVRPGHSRRQGSGKRAQAQEAARRAFAESTLRRFKAKLEGLQVEQGAGPSQERRTVVLTVEEQVDKLLQQATSLDNLALMYEGWTPWI